MLYGWGGGGSLHVGERSSGGAWPNRSPCGGHLMEGAQLWGGGQTGGGWGGHLMGGTQLWGRPTKQEVERCAVRNDFANGVATGNRLIGLEQQRSETTRSLNSTPQHSHRLLNKLFTKLQ